MQLKRAGLLATAAMAAGLLAASPASALNFNLHDTGGAGVGTLARSGFDAAAFYWGHTLKNNVTVNLNIGFTALGPGILGSTSSPRVGVFTSDVETLLNLNTTKSALDVQAVANLPTLDAAGALSVITSGYKNAAKQGVNTATQVYDTDDSANNYGLAITRANAKALGFTGLPGGDTATDASITFSSAFSFDFDPTDGIANNSYDFLGVAIHEIGHALGFVSGVDSYDSIGNSTSLTNLNNFVVNSALDLFRYSNDPGNLAPGGAALDWSVGGNPFFSVDKGASMFSLGGETGLFSTGAARGDGRQASHWKDNTYAGGALCSNPTKTPIGILDPTSGRCEQLAVTAMDLAAFDVMGWNLGVDVLANGDYRRNTAQIFNMAVPEPSTWIELILGFGAMGAFMRRRRSAALTA